MPHSETRAPGEDPAHDVLAAEMYAVPAPDPRLHGEEVHDVLAAEMYVVPAPDPAIHHGPVVLPGDLTGGPEPRDVLVAEEFAMPAPVGGGIGRGETGGVSRGTLWSRAALVVFVVVLARRGLRRG